MKSGADALEPKIASILVLVADSTLRNLLLEILDGPQTLITVVAAPSEAKALLAARSYSVVVATNFGVSPWEAVAVIPANRSYPAFFLSGTWDAQLEDACRIRPSSVSKLRSIQAPLEMRSTVR
jgi:hypothetical protein